MDEREQQESFDGRHASDAVEVTVLTGDWTGGGHSTRGDVLWTRTVDLLAHVDEHGSLVDRGRLAWLVPAPERDAGPHELAPHAQYVVRARRAAPDPAAYAAAGIPVPDLTGSFALDAVVGPARLPTLDERLAQWVAPTVVSAGLDAVGDLTLRRTSGTFEGTLAWVGQEVVLLLDVDEGRPEGAETCDAALARLRELLADAEAVDARWRAGAATHLLELARDWQADVDDAGGEPLTAAAFADRIRLSSLSISTDGSVTPDYDDGDLFLGHAVLVHVEPDGSVSDAEIAG